MTKEKPRNLAASVRQRLMNLARARNEDFQFVLTRNVLERLLYRLSRSEHRDVFVLKGAIGLEEVVDVLRSFLMPLAESITANPCGLHQHRRRNQSQKLPIQKPSQRASVSRLDPARLAGPTPDPFCETRHEFTQRC